MASCEGILQDPKRSGLAQSENTEVRTARRCYERPCIARRIIHSVVMGGSVGKVEQHQHQGHKRS